MTNTLPESTVDRTSTQGLEDLLTPYPDNNPDQGQLLVDDWSLEETAEYLGLSIKTIRRRLRDGKLAGYKIIGPNGPEWRVKQISVDNDQPQGQPGTNRLSTVQGELISTIDNPLDTSFVRELMAKLENLTYRNGYLEAQLAAKEEQIQLLTDSQHKPSWWQKARSWITKSKTQ